MTRLTAVAKKELLQLKRDRLTLGMVLGIPLAQLLLFGWAVNTNVTTFPAAVLDQDGSSLAQDLVTALTDTGAYAFVHRASSRTELDAMLRSDRVDVGLIVPRGFEAAVAKGQGARTELLVDGSDPMTVRNATDPARTLLSEWSATAMERELGEHRPGAARPFVVDTQILYNPSSQTQVFLVPGLIGVILTMTMVMLTAMAVARERERGTLEALIVSPIGRLELIAGKVLPYIGIGYFQMTIVLLVGRYGMKVPVQGVGLLYAMSFVFIAVNLAIGLVFSTVAKSQHQAMQMAIFFLLPNMLLSGFMFPFDGLPRPAQVLAEGLPLTHFVRIARRISLHGASGLEVLAELGWLVGILALSCGIASLRLRKRFV